MCIVFSSLDEGPCKTYHMSKVTVGLLWKTNSSLQTSVPCRAAKGSLGVFFGIHWKSNKMQRCWSQGTASDKQNCWALHRQVKAKILRQKEVCLRRQSVKVGSVLCCCGSLTAPSVQHLSGSSLESGLPALSCFIPTPSPCGRRGADANTSMARIN